MAEKHFEERFDGKKILVTGAGRGFGRMTAVKLAERGAEVFALSKTKANLESLKAEVPSIHIIQQDVTEWDNTRAAVERLGPLDGLVNNAGILIIKPFLETSKEDVDELYDVNIKSMINISQVVGKGMVQKGGGGSIVNIASISSQKTTKDLGVYCTTKAAVEMLTKVMAAELGPQQIRVNSVNPTIVETDMAKLYTAQQLANSLATIPIGRFPTVEETVNCILFLLSDRAQAVNGAHLYIDGGQKC